MSINMILVEGNCERQVTEAFWAFPREAREVHWYEMIYFPEADKTVIKLEWAEEVELIPIPDLLKGFKYEVVPESQGTCMDNLEELDGEFGIL